MVTKKRFFGLALSFALVMSATFFAGCSSYPTVSAKGKSMEYSVLGYVGKEFDNYDAAFAAAKRSYPNADAVIVVTGRATDKLIPRKVALGYYAVKFEQKDK